MGVVVWLLVVVVWLVVTVLMMGRVVVQLQLLAPRRAPRMP
jgi:hypothetical protein